MSDVQSSLPSGARRLAGIALLVGLLAPRAARADEPLLPPPQQREPAAPRNRFVADPITDFGLLSAAFGFSALLEALISTGELAPQQPSSSSRLLSIDRGSVTRSIDTSAGTKSNVAIGIIGAYSLAAPVIAGFEFGKQAFVTDSIILAESLAFTWTATNLAKIAVRRPRPLAYQRQKELEREAAATGRPVANISETDTALSFFSGHTSIAAAMTSTATYLAFARHPGTARPWIILAAGTLLTTAVGYYRVSSGKHFPTDVIAGGMAGAGIGLIVPHFHREDTPRQRPVWLGSTFSDTEKSLSLNGIF
jgi:membrane-associated phospholipid phosphatase